MDLKKIGNRRVISVLAETSLEDASRLMRENHVGDVVVIEPRGDRRVPIGMLTDRDIVLATIAIGAPVAALAAGDIMSSEVVMMPEDGSLSSAITLMKERGVRRIPLVGEGKDLRGILALEDVMSFLARELTALAEVSAREKEIETQRRRKLA
jgi:CBS domain-containing protein